MSFKLSKGPMIALSTVLGVGLVGGGGAAAIAMDKDTVTITADGEQSQVRTRAKDVKQLLEQQGITVGERDVVQPALSTKIDDGSAVTVLFARPLKLTVDGKTVTRWTTAKTVDQALQQLNLDDPKNILSTNRSAEIGRKGLTLTITTMKKVTVVTAKGTKVVEVPSDATVARALKDAGVTFGDRDIAKPGVGTKVSDGLKVTYQDVSEKPAIVKEQIPFDRKEVKDPDLAKGERKVVTKGVKGIRETTITEVFVDGKKVSGPVGWKKGSKVTKKPVTEVIAIGTKEPEEKKVEPTVEKKTSKQESATRETSSPTPVKQPTSKPKTPTVQPKANGYSGSCEASNYWQGQMTATGEVFNPWGMTAAHKTLPFGTMLRVTNVANGKSVVVRINDRGPYISGRCLDLSKGAFLQIASESAGVAQVTYTQV